MYYVIVDCVDMEDGYLIPDEKGINILKEYHKTKDFEKLSKKLKEYLKSLDNNEFIISGTNLFKHLAAAKHFGWDCNFLIKKIEK